MRGKLAVTPTLQLRRLADKPVRIKATELRLGAARQLGHLRQVLIGINFAHWEDSGKLMLDGAGRPVLSLLWMNAGGSRGGTLIEQEARIEVFLPEDGGHV